MSKKPSQALASLAPELPGVRPDELLLSIFPNVYMPVEDLVFAFWNAPSCLCRSWLMLALNNFFFYSFVSACGFRVLIERDLQKAAYF